MSGLNLRKEKSQIAAALGLRSTQNLSNSYLRSEIELTNTNIVKFDFLKNNVASPWGSEQLLGQNDKFFISMLGLFLLKRTSNVKTLLANYTGVLCTYLNRTILSAANDANIQAIYTGGRLRILKDRKEYIPAIDCSRFERVPQTQNNTTGGATTIGSRDARLHDLYGYIPVDQMMITGRDNLEINLELPVTADMSGANTYAILVANGYLQTNAIADRTRQQ